MKTDERTKAVEPPPEPAPPPSGRANRVCIFTETYYPEIGGGERQAHSLAEELIARGFQVFVLTRRSRHFLRKVEQVSGVTVYRLPPTGESHIRKWGLLLTGLTALIHLRRQYDLILVSGFRIIGLPAVLASILLGKTCLLKADSLGEMSGDYFTAGLAKLRLKPSLFPIKLFLSLRNVILKQADAFVAISSEVSKELLACGVGPLQIKQIPNGLDTELFRPASQGEKMELRHGLGLPSGEQIFIYTGRLVKYKGLPLLLRVWTEIRLRHKNKYLLLVGSGGLDIHNCEAQLKDYVAANGLQNSIQFTGNVTNVQEYLQASDVFVFPTENEAFGISLIEAMACGLPCISTGVGGVKDILEHLQNGLVVEARDFQQLYSALDMIIRDNSLAARLGMAAWQTVQNMYSQEIVTYKYIELFKFVSSSYSTRSISDVRPGPSN